MVACGCGGAGSSCLLSLRRCGRLRCGAVGPTASARLWLQGRCAPTRLRLDRRILGLARRKLVLGQRLLGPSTAREVGVGSAALGAVRTRVPFPPRILAVTRRPAV